MRRARAELSLLCKGDECIAKYENGAVTGEYVGDAAGEMPDKLVPVPLDL